MDARVLTVRYDDDDKYIGVFDADGNQIDSRDFDTDANTGIVRDANGNATTLIYDDRGNVLQEIDADDNITYREYNDPANPDLETRIIDRRGFITDRTYDARGNVLTIAEIGTEAEPFAVPILTRFTYDAMNNVTSITNAESPDDNVRLRLPGQPDGDHKRSQRFQFFHLRRQRSP